MPNLYATPTEIKAAAPDAIQASTVKYDRLLLRIANDISRMIDRVTGCEFYPTVATRYFSPETESARLRVGYLQSLTSVAYTSDQITYTTVSTAYVVGEVESDRNGGGSWTHLRLLWNSTPIATFPAIEDGTRVAGVWARVEDRSACLELAGAISSGVTSTGTTLKVSNDGGDYDMYGFGSVFQVGRVVKIGSEFMEITAVSDLSTGVDTLTVIRGRNGSTASTHATSASVYVWRVPDNIREACIIESVKLLERGLQGFSNARATPELGQPVYEKKLDVQTVMLLQPYMEF